MTPHHPSTIARPRRPDSDEPPPALDTIEDALALADASGAVRWCNEAFESLIGRRRADIAGRALVSLLPLQKNGRPLPPKLHPARRAAAERRPLRGCYSMRRGRDVAILTVWGKRLPPRHGNTTVLFVLRDVTRHRRLPEDLERKTRELERSNAELRQFADALSHDLQAPLSTVKGYARLLADRCRGRLDADADAYLSYILDGTDWMNQLIEDLLDYSKIGNPKRPDEPASCRVALERSLSNLRAVIAARGARVRYSSLPVVSVPPLQLERLFQNLIENALKFHGAWPPRISVASERRGGEWTITVRDNGIGIDPRQQPRLFKVFERLNPHGKYPGTGIGLAACKKIVEENGGRIWVESQPGKGSAFRFTLPA